MSAELSPQDRRLLLGELIEVYHTAERIDGVLDDIRLRRRYRPRWDGSPEAAWRAVLDELEKGAPPGRISSLLEVALDRYPENETFALLADRYAPDDKPVRDLPDQVRVIMDPDHFLNRITLGRLDAGRPPSIVFSGRHQERERIYRWAHGAGPAVLVVTGNAGSGKSALLGAVVYSAHPKLSLAYRGELLKTGVMPARIDRIAIVHARGRSVEEITWALAHQWSLGGGPFHSWTPARLIGAVPYLPEPPSLVLDALDRAKRPHDVVAALLVPLATAVSKQGGRPACRLLVATRQTEHFDEFATAAGRLGVTKNIGHINLDLPSRADLEHYVALHLDRADREVLGFAHPALSNGLVKTLTAGNGSVVGYGQFLVARIWMDALLRRRELPWTPEEIHALLSDPLLSVPGIVDLDIRLSANLVPNWARPVVATLAFAEGDGMPEPVIRSLAPEFRPGQPTREQINEAIIALDPYLTYGVDNHDVLLYRLGHDGLVAAARHDPYGFGLPSGSRRDRVR